MRSVPLAELSKNMARLKPFSTLRKPSGSARKSSQLDIAIFLSDFEQGEIGPDLFVAACQMGLEGLVSKCRDQPYRGGRSKHWIKVKNRKHLAMHHGFIWLGRRSDLLDYN